ncbi:alpha/beta fold hydrolase [Mycobacterium sp. PS03-16]|uniref:alpha/beta fold hydrolase n=1 Tax=Mycobacterium sp. PS03-16 TaxID=2559611 RepID=UPI001073F098|nr:alpha/beta fold hydrolase [Mycobacterium sp. PS03-16]TFV55281.1 alpha/beta fold hydrolase [Mycobacterium sp. PS03-16]
MDQYRRGELVFDVLDVGPPDAPVVVLLHGFPQFNNSWDAVMKRLTAQGYRCLAPNQRGYSPGARPTRRRDYRLRELVDDARALIDASGAERVHLVGHDWGANVAWGLATTVPQRLASMTVLSVPHPAAMVKALTTTRQALASWYVYFFQLPKIPERYLLGKDGDPAKLSAFMQSKGNQPPDAADRDARAMAEPGVLTAAINWYRALPLSNIRSYLAHVTVPTMYVWSEGDTALLEQGARECGRYVDGEYRFETLQGSHWLLDEQPDVVADLLLDWLSAHPLAVAG